MSADNTDRIEQFFEGKTVLVTGATGFLGKVIIEKLLRACPKVKQVVALVRTKKGKNPEQRMEEILNGPLFETLRKKWGPDHLNKVVAIEGDITKRNLNLCSEDKAWLCEEVEIVFHCAATVRFDQPLKTAVLINVKGTKQILDLAKGMRNLQVFQHISTAYCHLEEKKLLEKAYEPPANPHHILKLCELLRDEEIEFITPRLLGRIPNTYAYTKALAEALVLEEMDKVPALIIRPSVVVPIWKEPIPGWTDNLNGPAGLLIGAGKGVIRTMYIKENSFSDYIPVDVVANAILTLTFLSTLNTFRSQRIYHITSNEDVRVSYDEIINMGRKIVETIIPLPGVAWYPGGSIKRSKFYNNLSFLLFQWIPALLVDTILFVLGFEPVLMRVQRRIAKGCEVMEYYANNEWIFSNQRTKEKRTLLNLTERKKYKLDCDGFDYEEYFTNCVLCARRYILNEPDENIPAAKRHMFV
ncbi:fatty acyl-CoA reductase 1-like [Coccinella septempunctata]|uniref:fatty acyl-CoA reductase 1-like n=1 Tax=Coccinella septempunctata TaxID=41139 RepID=UPI001D074E7A|nr:fatty acyl-CoA reductase 1-like [Coccinella septempunctata]